MNRVCISGLALPVMYIGMVMAANAQDAFTPLAIEREHKINFDASPEEVFSLLNPEGGNHWSRDTPAYVFGAPDQPNEATLHITWRVAGLSEQGNKDVQQFFDAGWDWRMEGIQKTYNSLLEKNSKETIE